VGWLKNKEWPGQWGDNRQTMNWETGKLENWQTGKLQNCETEIPRSSTMPKLAVRLFIFTRLRLSVGFGLITLGGVAHHLHGLGWWQVWAGVGW